MASTAYQQPVAYFDMQTPVAMTTFTGRGGFQAHQTTYGKLHTVTWAGLVAHLAHPQAFTDKKQQPLFKFGVFADNCRAKGTLGMHTFYGIELDFDDGITDQAFLVQCLQYWGLEALVYSSFSNVPGQVYKSRVVLPCSGPISTMHGINVNMLRNGLVYALNNTVFMGRVTLMDSTTENRCFYYGRNPAQPYFFQHVRGAAVDLVLAQQARAELQRMLNAQQREAEEAAVKKAQAAATREQRLHDGILDAKDYWNQTYSVADMLGEYGYTLESCGRYAKPGASGKNVPGVAILTGTDGVERAFSHHANDPLSAHGMGGAVHAYDAFNIMCTLRFGGDFRAAIAYAGQTLTVYGEPLTQYNLRKQAEANYRSLMENSQHAAALSAATTGANADFEYLVAHANDDAAANYALFLKLIANTSLANTSLANTELNLGRTS